MSTRPATDSTTDWHATVAVRIPRDGDGNLVDAASRRLAAPDDVNCVDVANVQAIEPALAATVVRLAVRVQTAACHDAETVEATVANAPGVVRVEELSPA